MKCGGLSYFASQPSMTHVTTLDKLTRERDELTETLSKHKSLLEQSHQHEFEAYMEVKKSAETAENAKLEKAEVSGCWPPACQKKMCWVEWFSASSLSEKIELKSEGCCPWLVKRISWGEGRSSCPQPVRKVSWGEGVAVLSLSEEWAEVRGWLFPSCQKSELR